MLNLIVMVIILGPNVFCLNDHSKSGSYGDNKIFIYNRYKYEDFIYVTVNDTVEQFMDFYEESDQWHGYPTRVHVFSNDSITSDHPLFITATQQKGVSSWQLPLVVNTMNRVYQFNDTSRTLCPHDAGPNVTSVNRPSLQVTTSSPVNVTAVIKLRRVSDFFVQVDKEVTLEVKPSTPKYFYFSFSSTQWNQTHAGMPPFGRFNYTVPKSVILIAESDDDICATISIQNNSCPVFDNERNVLYQGYYLTMTTKGGITLTEAMFPQGFYIVFIVRDRDDECTGEAASVSLSQRIKKFRFRVVATISYAEYLGGAAAALAAVAAVALLAAAAAVRAADETPAEVEASDASSPEQGFGDGSEPLVRPAEEVERGEVAVPGPLTVAGLARASSAARERRSDRYFWNSLTVAVVYALPVVQLLFTYQRMVYSTGNQDLCYYNFLCAHPLWSLSDFNHVYSNVGYVVLGLVFMLQVSRTHTLTTGIPQHRGLLYALGLSLAMEGLLSACYHLCPNKMNFQFDSTFMYVMAVLCIVKLYQSRHADVNASAHSTFALLACFMAIVLFGILWPSVWFWAAFTVLHLGAGLALTLNVYYVGRVRTGVARAWHEARGAGGVRALRPAHALRATLLALAYAANTALAVYGLVEHKKDFARHLLGVLMANALLYTCFYVAMKLVHRERVPVRSWLAMGAAAAAAGVALAHFLSARTKWSQTPAQSRQHNAVCDLLQFYDSHDVWHVASAAAMFLYFNMLLTIDDGLRHTPRHLIPVF